MNTFPPLVIRASAGTGKTFLAVACAVDALQREEKAQQGIQQHDRAVCQRVFSKAHQVLVPIPSRAFKHQSKQVDRQR